MQLIIHDVESIVQKGRMYEPEIIEIAAVRAIPTEDGVLRLVDTFHSYVEPQTVNSIPIPTTALTGITQTEVRRSGRFREVIHSFIDWLGSEEYYLCSWSLSDRTFFIRDCKRHEISMNWIQNYNDIQKWFAQKYNLTKRPSLGTAMALLDLVPHGKNHSALADTLNTFHILSYMYDKDDPVFTLDHNDCSGVFRTEVVYQEEFKNNPFAALKNIL